MVEFRLDRRALLRGVTAAASGSALSGTGRAATPPAAPDADPHTRVTFAAVVDAVVPRTPELGEELGPEHVPGGLAVGLDAYLVTYVDTLFSRPTPLGERAGNLRLAESVALVLDEAAAELLARRENEDPPRLSSVRDLLDRSTTVDEAVDATVAGPFARLSRDDRLNALTLLDRKELDTKAVSAATGAPVLEGDAGLVPQLVVGFTEVLYYSEWQGYDDFTAPPSDREFTNDPAAVQSWRQTDFPGVADGYAAFRGYWGAPDSSLGRGRVWKRFDDEGAPKTITLESGSFRENDYDTSDYEEPFPEGGDGDGTVGDGESTADGDGESTDDAGATRPADATATGEAGADLAGEEG